MFKNYSIFILIFFCKIILSFTNSKTNSKLTNESSSPNIAVTLFKTYYKNFNDKTKISSLDYYNKIHLSKLYLKLEAPNNQYLHIFVSVDDKEFCLDDHFSEQGNLQCPYSSQLSPSYYLYDKPNLIYEHGYDNSDFIWAKDSFKFYNDLLLKQYELINLKFQHFVDKNKNITFSCGKTGLKLPSYNINKKGNLISQIHELVNNVDLSFTFKYTKNDITKNINELNEGLFIIGIQSYEKKKNTDINSIYVSQINYGKKDGWKFDIYNIFIGNNYFDFDELNIEINFEIDGFGITYDFYEKLNEYFFNPYYNNGTCVNEKINFERNIIIYCYPDKFKKKDINNFPTLNFFKNQINYNFTFTGEELFQEINDKIFFKMITNTEFYQKDIIFGKLFLKKYQVIFNSDYKTISFYKINNNNNIMTNCTDNSAITLESNKKEKIFSSILFIFIGVLILILGIFLGKRFCNISRKIHANELEDNNYVYESKKTKEKNNKEYLLIDV